MSNPGSYSNRPIHATTALVALFWVGGCKTDEKHAVSPDAGPDGGGNSAAPDTTIDQAPDMFSRNGQATFRFSSSDPAATFECRIDREAAQPCQSPYVRTLPD